MIYSPAEDSFLLAKFVKKYSKNKSVLDVGTGSGILARTALESKASKVLAIDINNEAVNNEAVNNAKSQGIYSLKSDLFSNIKEKFDLIVFNPPYLPLDKREDKESQQATTGGKKGDEIIIRFLKEAPQYLEKSGRILLLLSSLTPRERILQVLSKNNQKVKTIGKKKIFMENLEVWLITVRKV